MIAINLKLDGDGAWPELAQAIANNLVAKAVSIHIAGLARGMVSGKPSVTIRFDLDDGTFAIAETSLALFLMAADGLKARYGDPRDDVGLPRLGVSPRIG